jgi:glycosyltransferase involved in cell wall biosynthesis
MGGGELTFRHLVDHLDTERFEVLVASPPWPALAETVTARGMTMVTLPLNHWPRTDVVRGIARLVRTWRPDIVHSHLLLADIYTALASRLARPCRLVSTVQGVNYRWELEGFPRRQRYWLFARGYRLVYRAFDALVACSAVVRDAVCAGPGARIRRDRIGVIHNAADIVRLRRDAAVLPRATPGPRPRLITVANLDPVKGHDLLLRALVLLDDVPFECLLVGDGPLRGTLEAQVRALGLTERVRFLGRRHDVPALVRGSDLFVFPSLWEGFGIAAVEAMALEVPVVAVARGAMPEIIEDGVTGLLAPAEPAALAAAIRRGLTDETFRERAVPAALARAEAFDARAMVRKYEGWYESLS